MSDYIVKLPTPHEKQVAFLDSTAKRKVIVAGRRGGKTTGMALLAAEAAMQGRRVLEAAPVADQTDAFWEKIVSYFSEPIYRQIVYKSETKRLMILPNNGRIRCKTAFNADMLRGDWGDLILLDEYAQMDPDIETVVAPMLLDNNGDLVYGGTPKRRNHFFIRYNQAVGDVTGRWGHWHFTSYDNPHLSKAALEEISKDLTEDAYRQEILAEFLENEGAVFRNIAACMNATPQTPEDHTGHYKVMGADWGKQSDFTCLSIGCSDCKIELAIDRFNQIDYAYQRQRLQVLADKWEVTSILAEQNAMGDPIIEELQRSGLPVTAFQTTATTKPPLIENLGLTLERVEFQFIADPVWTGELEAYERKVSPITGRSQYSAPEGMHDDTVMARALMAWGAVNKSWTLY